MAARPAVARARRLLFAAVLTAPLLVTAPSTPAATPYVEPFAVPLPIPEVLTDPEITLTAQAADVPILSGAPTRMWTYNGTFPGPTIRRPSGVPTKVTLVNQLPTEAGELTLHHHGAHAASEHDGQPMDLLVPRGSSRTYEYGMVEAGEPERGALQWYHDHRMDVTGRNVWMGLAGMFIVDDPAEAEIDAQLPSGEFDVPLMIVDRRFGADNQLSYQFNSEGVLGDVPLVNGAPQPYFEVAARKYRLRLLNASNMRSYSLELGDTATFQQVGSESGLLEKPLARRTLTLGPAERADVVVDFTGMLGRSLVLRNVGGLGAMAQVMQFRVTRQAADDSVVPSSLRPARVHDTSLLTANRTWVLGRDTDSGMWTINGKGFEHHRVDATPELGTAERWTFVNSTSLDHIVHIHDVDWDVVFRSGGLPALSADELDGAGAKESFRIRANEVVVVESTFTDFTGRFVWHCHMLEHEDFAMMTQFEVVPRGGAPAGSHGHSHHSH